jgi:hypothetical protein
MQDNQLLVKKFIHPDRKYAGLFIHFPQEEAIRLIHSLTQQILKGNPNNGRLEYYGKHRFAKGSMRNLEYLTICVDPPIAKGD